MHPGPCFSNTASSSQITLPCVTLTTTKQPGSFLRAQQDASTDKGTCCISLATWVQSQSWGAEWTPKICSPHTHPVPLPPIVYTYIKKKPPLGQQKKILFVYHRIKCFFLWVWGLLVPSQSTGEEASWQQNAHWIWVSQSLLCGPHRPSLELP